MPPRGSITRKRRIALAIYSLALEANPGATQEHVHEWVAAQAPVWMKTSSWSVPEISRAKDYIREITLGRDWLDDPWHLGIFAAHQSTHLAPPPDAIPDVLMVALRVFAGGKRLTARQAKWVADLRPLMGTLSAGDDGAVQDAYALAVTYAARGRAAAALAKATGLVEPPIPLGHESDTWALDVTLAATSTENHLITWNTFEAITEAGLVNEPIWEEGGLRGSVRTEVPSAIPLYELLLEASFLLTKDCRAMTSALLRLRARTESGVSIQDIPFHGLVGGSGGTFRAAQDGAIEWNLLNTDEQLEEARKIGEEVLAELEPPEENQHD